VIGIDNFVIMNDTQVGLGLVAIRPLKKGQVAFQYKGTMSSSLEEIPQEALRVTVTNDEGNYIVGDPFQAPGALVNDPLNTTLSNLEWGTNHGGNIVDMVCTTNVEPGEVFMINYGLEFWLQQAVMGNVPKELFLKVLSGYKLDISEDELTRVLASYPMNWRSLTKDIIQNDYQWNDTWVYPLDGKVPNKTIPPAINCDKPSDPGHGELLEEIIGEFPTSAKQDRKALEIFQRLRVSSNVNQSLSYKNNEFFAAWGAVSRYFAYSQHINLECLANSVHNLQLWVEFGSRFSTRPETNTNEVMMGSNNLALSTITSHCKFHQDEVDMYGGLLYDRWRELMEIAPLASRIIQDQYTVRKDDFKFESNVEMYMVPGVIFQESWQPKEELYYSSSPIG
jgi:hypothetical protein